MTRQQLALRLMRIAARHGDRIRWYRLTQAPAAIGLSYEACETAWDEGQAARERGERCACPNCEPEPEDAPRAQR